MPNDRIITFREAILESIAQEMRADGNIILMGEDVGAAGGVFNQTVGLFKEFGDKRVIDTPISEAGAFGMAVGAAMMGLRPIFEVMFGDFLTLVMDQLVNQAAKVRYMSAGRSGVPLVLRTTMGLGSNLGPQHSQSFHAWAAHVPGLKVVMPSNPADAKGLFTAAIRDDDPVLVFEDRLLYQQAAQVPEGDHLVPIGSAHVARRGRDVSVVAFGRMVSRALSAADTLALEGIEIEVIDGRSLYPLDSEAIVASVRHTHRALILDSAPKSYGITGEIAAIIGEEAFDWLDAPVRRLAAAHTPVPISRTLEPLVAPDIDAVVIAVRQLMT